MGFGRDRRCTICRLRRLLVMVLSLAALAPAGAQAASRYDPALRFRVLTTPHFFIYFHQGESALAARLAVIAEDVHRNLAARLLYPSASRTHVVLVDQNDVANGWATPLPYNTIEITAAPPAPHDVIGNTNDWMRLVFAHEYTHIVQLDRSRGYASVLRAVFGRSPIAFPNLCLPMWQVEGLAVYEESAVTGRGRVHAGDFAVIVGQAARERRAFPLDRATSDFDNWPDGNTPYAYGAFFYQFLVERFGEAKLAELNDRAAGRFYFLQSPVFRRVYGESLGDLWKDFETSQAAGQPAGTPDTGRRLTLQGYVVSGPQFVMDANGQINILYSSQTSDDFPSLNVIDMKGHTRRVASRYLGDHVSVAQGGAIFDQEEVSRNVALRSDLYRLDLASGQVARLSEGGRLLDPAIDAAGSRLAAVAVREGERHLVVWDVDVRSPKPVTEARSPQFAVRSPDHAAALRRALAGPPRLTLAEPGMDYSSPRWSPDGAWLAAARVIRSGPSEIVLVDPRTGQAFVVATTATARNVTPAWTPDGRTIVFASDRGGGPFNLYAVDLDAREADGAPRPGAIRQITNFATGATYPTVSPDGRMLAYVGYTTAGYDVFVLDWRNWVGRSFGSDQSERTKNVIDPQPEHGNHSPVIEPGARGENPPDPVSSPVSGYTPWRTLWPRYWTPAFDLADEQIKLGAATAGQDVLGHHAYSAEVLARVGGQAGVPGSPRIDWDLTYVYDRWLPAFFATASDRTHFLTKVSIAPGLEVPADLREQELELGISLPSLRVRYQQAWTASFDVNQQTERVGPSSLTENRNGLRLSWVFSSAKVYARSISPEQGITAGVGGEIIRPAFGADGTADDVTADARAYVRLGGQHAVLAVRGGYGAARGDFGGERTFYLGGPGPDASPVDFGSDALNLLRGFDLNAYWGSHVVVGNFEYRLPILRIERGHGTFPLFVRTVYAAAFADIGKTWTSSFSARAFARSEGAELAADLRVGYDLPVTVVVGVAWPHDDRRGLSQPVVYVRLGHAF